MEFTKKFRANCGELFYMNKLVEQFGNEKRWVNWTYKTVGGKQTKVPLGKSNDPDTWNTYMLLKDKEHVGIMFGIDNMFLGIDIDKCIENSEVNSEVSTLINNANTYTEISPSGTGLHLYFKLSDPLELVANKKAPYECYTSLRFFTVTGESWHKEPKDVRTITPYEAEAILSITGYPWGKEEKVPIENNQTSPLLSNEEVLEKIFNSKNGDKIKALYNGNTSEYSNDDSSADMALCSHLAFWTGKNAKQMEEIWLASPLGAREKTQSREDYRARTIDTAIKSCTEVYTNETQDGPVGIDFDFLCKVKGKQKIKTMCVENIAKILRLHPLFKDTLRFDEFKGHIEIKKNDKWEQFNDSDILTTQILISSLFTDFQTIKKDMTFDAICIVAFENKFDSAVDYIKSITWDKKPRLDTWLCHTYGVQDNVYHRAVASNWLKGLVKRIIYPGCKFDYVLVLEGPQGTKKSSSLGLLGGDWHVETTMSTETKDFFMQFSAKAIVEFSEGETLSRTEVKRMKAIITTQSDKFRAPYERISKDHPRRCVFAMTTNSSEYLKDETGNRRWLPVETVFPEANLEWLAENRDQLFAEAYERVIVQKESTWEFPQEETIEAQNSRRISDPNTELVVDWYLNALKESQRRAGITVLQVHIEAFGNQFSKKMTKFEEMSIANILKDHLKLDKRRGMVNGIRTTRWYPSNMTDAEIKEQQESQVEFNFTSDKIQQAFNSF